MGSPGIFNAGPQYGLGDYLGMAVGSYMGGRLQNQMAKDALGGVGGKNKKGVLGNTAGDSVSPSGGDASISQVAPTLATPAGQLASGVMNGYTPQSDYTFSQYLNDLTKTPRQGAQPALNQQFPLLFNRISYLG